MGSKPSKFQENLEFAQAEFEALPRTPGSAQCAALAQGKKPMGLFRNCDEG